MFCDVYVLRNEKNSRFYIGYSGDLETRLFQHNAGKVKATRYLRPMSTAYTEAFETSTEARKRERYLKSLKSHEAIEDLIDSELLRSNG